MKNEEKAFARSDQPQLRACESDQRGLDRGGSMPREIHNCSRVDDLMTGYGFEDMDELKHALEDWGRWQLEIVTLGVRSEALKNIGAKYQAYKDEMRRVYGNVTAVHMGRCGRELNELFAALDGATNGNQVTTQSSGGNRGSEAQKSHSHSEAVDPSGSGSVRTLIQRWRANADMLAEGNKNEHADPSVGMQRACADELEALLALAPTPQADKETSHANETSRVPTLQAPNTHSPRRVLVPSLPQDEITPQADPSGSVERAKIKAVGDLYDAANALILAANDEARRVVAWSQFDQARNALIAAVSAEGEGKMKKDLSAGLIHQLASPLAETEPRLNITREEAIRIGRDAIVHSTLPAVGLWQSAADVVTNALYDAFVGGLRATVNSLSHKQLSHETGRDDAESATPIGSGNQATDGHSEATRRSEAKESSSTLAPEARQQEIDTVEGIAQVLRSKAAAEALAPYLKAGETVVECVMRNRNDVDILLGQLASAKRRAEALEAEIARLKA